MPHEHGAESSDLHWLRSPIAKDASIGSHVQPVCEECPSDTGTSPPQSRKGLRDGPEFERHEEATSAELFFDLFFAANLTVFSQVHEISDRSRLVSYVGFFTLLWFTWAMVMLFDVRFVSDSVFARAARAGQLGVMIAFAVVSGNFHLEEQDQKTFKTLSIALAVSRLILAVQYAAMVWHVRKYERTKRPLGAMSFIHFVCAMLYLGISFRFTDHNSTVYVAWFVIAGMEMLMNLGLSCFMDVLSLKGTHLVNRMALLTFITIGEGVIVICHAVTNIVLNSDSWTPATIGNVTTAVANVYFVWMLYNDWQPTRPLSSYRQILWAFTHFPFHLVLVLFVGGSAQFIVWFKIIESVTDLPWFYSINTDDSHGNSFTATGNMTRREYVDTVDQLVHDTFEAFPPKSPYTLIDYAWALGSLDNLSDVFWGNITNPLEQAGLINTREVGQFVQAVDTLDKAIINSLFNTFQIDGLDDVDYTNPVDFESAVYQANTNRFEMVVSISMSMSVITSTITTTTSSLSPSPPAASPLADKRDAGTDGSAEPLALAILVITADNASTQLIYAFVSAGAVLLLMSLLLATRRARCGWNRLNVLQMMGTVTVGVGLALTSIMTINDSVTSSYMMTPWPLPTLCLALFLVLLLNHVPRAVPSLPVLRRKRGEV